MEDFFTAGIHWRILNFLIFLVVAYFALRKPVKEFWAGRTHQIRFDIEEAGKLKQEAKRRHEDLRRRLARIETEVLELVRSLEKEGEMEKQRMIDEAERLSQRIRQEGERIAVQEVKKAEEILKAQVVQLSVELAERLVKENLKDEDQRRLSEKYLTELERA